MCSGILFVGLLAALLDGDLQRGVPPSVVMGGALWAFSNFVGLPGAEVVVKGLGVAVGTAAEGNRGLTSEASSWFSWVALSGTAVMELLIQKAYLNLPMVAPRGCDELRRQCCRW